MECARSLFSGSLHQYSPSEFQQHNPLPSKSAPNYFFCGKSPFSISCDHRFLSSTFSNNPLTNSRLISSNNSAIDVSLAYGRIKEFTDDGLFEDAIRVYRNLLECGFPVEEFQFFPCLIKAFGGLCDVKKAKEIHGHLLKLGFSEDLFVNNALLSMYAKCGAIADAVRVFERMSDRDFVSWNAMISGFCHLGDCMNSLTYFGMMLRQCGELHLSRVACVSALSSCALCEFLTHGREIHGFLVKYGLDTNEFIVSALLEMYMKCGDVKNAQNVFNTVHEKEALRENRVIWNVMILGYISNELLSVALELFVDMLKLGIDPDSSTVVALLMLASQRFNLGFGRQFHRIILEFELENDARVETALMEMYFKCGDPETGLKIFKRSQNRNLVTWGSVISNCSQGGYPYEALQLFHDYLLDDGCPDSVTLLAALRASSSLALKSRGMEIHGLAIKMGLDSNVFVGGAIVDLYGKCRDTRSAQEVFDGLPDKDLVTWNALISGFAQTECPDGALKAFRLMLSKQIRPNSVTLACVLSVCVHLSLMILCKEVHCYVLRHGYDHNILVSNSLVSTYAKCGNISNSWTMFEKMLTRDKVSWNSIMLGLGMHGQFDKMFVTFEEMKEAGAKPDHTTITALLSACSHGGKVEMGWKYLKCMVEDYNLEPRIEQYTCMVDLLGRAGLLNQAYNLIMQMPYSPDDRIWGSLLGSCKNHGDAKLAEVVAGHLFEFDRTNTGYRVLLANLYEDSGRRNEVTRIRLEIKHKGLKKQPGCSWIEVNNSVHTFTAGDWSHKQSEEIHAVVENLMQEIKARYTPLLQSQKSVPDEPEDGFYANENEGLLWSNIV
ncbi:hypothetical protein K2173_026967 [Erythroxylum novogranatense]|uniref:Pentatricopeptide repeat-containing protein n=1 Tax=Erythroxylum novogranatense TaxID=1862640 RepID=A0AAV8TXT0_9ROSI|nr:hypothetical protein K2173_026967 [Erythroxylum novogranatense]